LFFFYLVLSPETNREVRRERERWGLRERSDRERDPAERVRCRERKRERSTRERERGPDHRWVCAEKAGGAISGGTQANFRQAVEDP
jgi:hypothetical protein